MRSEDTAFIICEYNPFHNGHKYHIEQTRKFGFKNIVCIMSGNYVQRGEPALFDKYLRAKAAVMNGADLVLELPMKYAVSNASRFAFGGVETMRKCGIGGTLSFGSSTDIKTLLDLYNLSLTKDFYEIVNDFSLSEGLPYPVAVSRAFLKLGNDQYKNILQDANNVLALEYIRNLKNDNFISIRRDENVSHDSLSPEDNMASGKYIRTLIENGHDISHFVPSKTYDLYTDAVSDGMTVDRNKFNTAMYSRLILLDKDVLLQTDNVSHGLENRIMSFINKASSTDELYSLIKTKRYTHSRIRQILLSSVLNIKRKDLDSGVKYINILGFNSNGQQLLKSLRKNALCPMITNLSDALNLEEAADEAKLCYNADSLYELCRSIPQMPYNIFKAKPYIEK